MPCLAISATQRSRQLTERVQVQNGFFEQLRPRSIWRRHILYNKVGMAALGAFNRLRWPVTQIPVVLWPPAFEFFDAIESDIRNGHRVTDANDYLIDAERFDEFVRQVYAIDSASPNKIDIKLGSLVRPPLIVRVLTIRFWWPHMEVQDILNRVRCKDVHRLKERLRADYCEKITDYIFDIIIHSTETAAQGTGLRRLLVQYGTPVSD